MNNFQQKNSTTVVLVLRLKHGKDFILNFSVSGTLFSEKQILNLHTVIYVTFPSAGCVDDVDN